MEKINSTNIIHGAIWDADKLPVAIEKQACSPRCLVSTPSTPRARKLIDDYEQGRQLDIPQRVIMRSYQRILTACKVLQAGRVGVVL